MYGLFRKLGLAILLMAGSTLTQADVVVNAETTTDTAQGLEFLHVGLTSGMTFEIAETGFSYGGYNWNLATVDQFLMLMEGATGVPIDDWNGTNLSDVNFSSVQAISMVEALDGIGGSSELAGFWVDGESFGAAQVYAHTSSNDFHLQQGALWGGTVPALFVRGVSMTAKPVPTLTIWSLVLLTIGMFGVASTALYRRTKT